MSYTQRGFTIPDHMLLALEAYIEYGIIPGDFLQAVICNDLKNAVGHADDENLRNLPAFAIYMYNQAPAQCWGDREKMFAWSKAKRAVHDFRQRHPDIVEVWNKS